MSNEAPAFLLMRRLMRVGVTLPLATVLACSQPDQQSELVVDAHQIAGCFRVLKSAWEPLPPGEPGTYQIPSIAELTLEPDEETHGEFSLRPALRTVQGQQPGRWQRLSPDSVRLYWGDGYVGVIARLQIVTVDSMAGRAMVFHDGGLYPMPEAEVALGRLPC